MVLEDLEPKLVWEIFEFVLSKNPRPSKKEARVRSAIKTWAVKMAKNKDNVLEILEDEIGNLLIRKAATEGNESWPSILLQGHCDMVCETNRPEGFNFDSNPIPIQLSEDGKWVEAEGTTLGADNGIGIALALALLFDDTISHGPLEVLITVDEETGLVGAFGLDIDALGIRSKLMINIDSELLGTMTIGSAGGGDAILKRQVSLSDESKDWHFLHISVSGLLGGHSGVDIHLPRGNANVLLARILSAISNDVTISLAEWNGGSKHNAIARESEAIVAVKNIDAAIEILKSERKAILSYYRSDVTGAKILEPEIEISWYDEAKRPTFSVRESKAIIATASALPHGPLRYSPSVEGLVETSSNFAIIETEEELITFHLSIRSSVDEEIAATRRSIAGIASLGHWNLTQTPAYPGWKPEPESPFLLFVKDIYGRVFGREVEVSAIHAGLETGIIGAKIPGIQMVSVGPDIQNAHTPDERVRISDIPVLYRLLKSVITEIPRLDE